MFSALAAVPAHDCFRIAAVADDVYTQLLQSTDTNANIIYINIDWEKHATIPADPSKTSYDNWVVPSMASCVT